MDCWRVTWGELVENEEREVVELGKEVVLCEL